MVLGSEIESESVHLQTESRQDPGLTEDPPISSPQISAFLHEIRNPITTLKTLAKLLQNRLSPEDKNRWIGQSIEQECRHLQELLSQFEQDLISPRDLQLHCLDLVTFLQDHRSTLEAIALDHGLTFQLEWDQSQTYPTVMADPVALRQVLGNLVDNACKYTPAGGDLVIRLRQEQQQIWIEVRDTGVGIDAETLAQIFTPFFRGTHDRPGQGLGLGISRDLIRQMGGEIEVDSELGQGSMFRVRLPWG